MDENTLKIVLGPAVVGIVEALKQAGLDTKYAPIVSIGLGALGALGIGLAYGHVGSALVMDVVLGMGIGAGATGVYAAVTTARAKNA